MKKQAVCLSLLLTFPPMALPAAKGNAVVAAVAVEQVKQASELSQIVHRLWARLRAYVPRTGLPRAGTPRTQITGLRGAEKPVALLEPYWKDDRSNDPTYVEEIEAFLAAVKLADAGELSEAATGFKVFAETYPDSSLKSHAQLALGLVYGQLGQKDKSIDLLKSFIQGHPSHPMADDARAMIKGLGKP